MSPTVLLLGNPNSGKSYLFNRLTGLKQKVANFPGVTVDIRSGTFNNWLVKDFPGLYSIDALTQDEMVAIDGFQRALASADTAAIVYVADGTRLQRSLYLLLQILPVAREHNVPVVVAVNILDEVIRGGGKVDCEGLAQELSCQVIGVSAKTTLGLDKLRKALEALPVRREVKAISAAGHRHIIHAPVEELKKKSALLARKYGPHSGVILKSREKLDSIFLSSVFGFVVFFVLMLILFQSIFTFAAPAMDAVSEGISWLGQLTVSLFNPGIFADFLSGALFEGMASVFVFVPQIFVLFVIIGILEDSGYLARAAIICHAPLSWFGLSGKAFVPFLSGHACAIPAIMAARTIESPKKRLLTQLAIPFMTCSARLPVYALLVAAFVPQKTFLGGFIGLPGVVFFCLYLLSIFFGLLFAGVLSKTFVKEKDDAPFIVELPPYRLPSLKTIFKDSVSRTLNFVKNAGWVIFIVVVAIWALGYFPQGAGHLDESYMGRLGHFIEPIFEPMGMDWKLGVAVLTSFLAREVFVGTLGTLYGLENAGDDPSSLIVSLQSSGMTLATALALMVFYALAMQCVSTLAVLRSETGIKKIPFVIFGSYTLIAYVAAMAAYQLARLVFL